MWLIKSEPFVYSWNRLLEDKRTQWNGVRNYQAATNLKKMRLRDQAFFYHSNEGREIVGIVEVVRQAYPDDTDRSGRFVIVDIVPVRALPHPVTLREIKQDAFLRNMAMIRQPRLSVSPVLREEWGKILHMGGLYSQLCG